MMSDVVTIDRFPVVVPDSLNPHQKHYALLQDAPSEEKTGEEEPT
jgi:hypothetical protein